MTLTSKLPEVGTTIFSVMSAMAHEYGAINVSQGFPDFPVDPNFVEILQQTAALPVHQYAPMPGLPRLTNQILNLIENQHGRYLSAENVLVTAGATQAIFTAIQALVHDGDEVLIIDPAYDCYAPAVALCKGVCRHIPLTSDLQLDLEKIKDRLNEKTRMIILNNPHNPTGQVFPKNDLKELVSLLEKFPGCLILSDEVYEFINFSSDQITMHQFETIHERLITVSSFGKTLHMTGWKLGYLTAFNSLMKEILKVHQFNVFSVSHFAQSAVASYLEQYEVGSIAPLYKKKREVFRSSMEDSKFRLLPCEGSYFQVLDYSELSDMDDLSFTKYLTQEVGVATIPLSVFYKEKTDKKMIRVCFAKSDDVLTQAAQRLCQI